MFCPKCGIESGPARFCRSCGTNLTIISNVLDERRSKGIILGKKTTLSLFQTTSLSNHSLIDGHTAVAIFSSTRVDLTAEPLAIGETRFTVISIFGSVNIVVPDDVALRVTGVANFASVKVAGRELSNGMFGMKQYETHGYSVAPRRLHIDATSIFGEIKFDE